MRTQAHPLAPLFRSQTQEQVLATLFLDVDHAYNILNLARKIHMPYASVHREVERLVSAGLLIKERVGQAYLVHPNKQAPTYGPLRDLLLVAFGAAPLLAQALHDIPGIQAVVLYGSYAARLKGIDGPPPQDIDVLVVGEPDPLAVFAAVRRPSQMLGLPVNPTILDPSEWHETTAFTDDIRRGVIIPIFGVLDTEAVDA